MRDLTVEELALAPKWATHYAIEECGIYFSCESGFALYDTISKSFVEEEQDCPLSCIEEGDKPMPKREFKSKPFDIAEHKLNKHLTELESGNLGVNDCGWIIDKEYAIAIAKHFKLNESDLK